VVTEEETRRSVLALEIPEVTVSTEAYDGPLRTVEEEISVEETKEVEVTLETPDVAMEEVVGEAQPKVAEKKKKKKKNNGRKAGEAESSHHRKEREQREK